MTDSWRIVLKNGVTLAECQQVMDANGGMCPDCYFEYGD